MRLGVRLRAIVAVLAVAACSKGTEGGGPASVTVGPTPLTLTAINATQQLTAVVKDASGATITGLTTTWSSSNTAIVDVNAGGVATAKANGTATITATAGGVNGTLAVTVAQAPAVITKAAGDAQTGPVGQALPTALAVHIVDALGTPVANATVTFAPTAGSGSVGTPSAVTNATGDATTTWTLGTSTATSMSVQATSGAAANVFTATPTAGPVASVTVVSGNNQTGGTGSTVAVRPSVKVTDSFGNAKAGVTVVFAVTAGGGSVTGANQVTDAGGNATVGSWTLGSAGTNTLSATAQGTAVSFSFTATAVTAGAPANIAAFVGNGQTGLVGFATNVRPAVKVTDNNGIPVSGVSVTFAVATGGGSVTNATVSTNSAGVAQVGSWTLGAGAGSNTLTATAAPGGITGNPLTITATAASPTFNITIRNVGPAFSPAVQSAFDSAVAKWQRVIYQDIGSSQVTVPANGCGFTHSAINEVVNDILILARVDAIDGPGTIIGQAGFCAYRASSSLLPVLGDMVFDSADMANLASTGRLKDVILHEMGHALGFGTLWNNPIAVQNGVTFPGVGCLQNPSSTGNAVDTYYSPGPNTNSGFTCTQALTMFDSIGGTNYTSGNRVPLENGIGQGSFNSHWRENVFFTELMTPVISASGTANPMSVLTIASMGDLGYTVNLAAADAYSPTTPFHLPSPAIRTVPMGTYLDNDILIGPLYGVSPLSGTRRVR